MRAGVDGHACTSLASRPAAICTTRCAVRPPAANVESAARCSRDAARDARRDPSPTFGSDASSLRRTRSAMSVTCCAANGTCRVGNAPAADVDDRLRVRPRPRQQLDGIEADADDQIARRDERLLDARVREHAGKPRVIVGHDAFGLVGDHRRHAAALAEARMATASAGRRAPRPTITSGRRACEMTRLGCPPELGERRSASALALGCAPQPRRRDSWRVPQLDILRAVEVHRARRQLRARLRAPRRCMSLRASGRQPSAPLRDRPEERLLIELLMLEARRRPRTRGCR